MAVGDHLMLGGDNIDLALAHRVEKTLGGARLDAEQWSALRQACRVAKEKLLGDTPAARWPVTIAGRGSKLIGGSIQSELTRDQVQDVVIDGFFPRVGRGEEPGRGARAGLQEFGLPFVADPAITRHLGSFLRRHRTDAIGQGQAELMSADRPARPDAILFNGGALTPAIVRDRVVEVVTDWFKDDPGPPFAPRVLANASLDLAVAYGAAYYGVVRRGRRHPDRGRYGALVLRGLRVGQGRSTLALRGPARCAGGGRDRHRAPRFRPADGPAGRVPPGEQLGPPGRPTRRPCGRRP